VVLDDSWLLPNVDFARSNFELLHAARTADTQKLPKRHERL